MEYLSFRKRYRKYVKYVSFTHLFQRIYNTLIMSAALLEIFVHIKACACRRERNNITALCKLMCLSHSILHCLNAYNAAVILIVCRAAAYSRLYLIRRSTEQNKYLYLFADWLRNKTVIKLFIRAARNNDKLL